MTRQRNHLNRQTIHGLMKVGYEKDINKKTSVGDYQVDKSLSGRRTTVFYNPNTSKSVIVHRGTASIQDALTDAGLLSARMSGSRFQHAKKMQKKTEKKYGSEHVTTMGHSLGGLLAEKYGKKSSQIITYNKAAVPATMFNRIPKKQTDIRTRGDVVSLLSRFQRRKSPIQDTTIGRNTKFGLGPLKSHALDNLKYN
jgi:alpha-beta hydrolase superfamily lysophospholipase